MVYRLPGQSRPVGAASSGDETSDIQALSLTKERPHLRVSRDVISRTDKSGESNNALTITPIRRLIVKSISLIRSKASPDPVFSLAVSGFHDALVGVARCADCHVHTPGL